MTAAVLAVALVGTLAVPASAAPAAPTETFTVSAAEVAAAPDVRFTSSFLGGYVSFYGREARTAKALALMFAAGAAVTGCIFIKPTSPVGVASRVICGGLGAVGLLLVARQVNKMIDADPRAVGWCFQVGPINKLRTAIMRKPVAELKVVGLEHCR